MEDSDLRVFTPICSCSFRTMVIAIVVVQLLSCIGLFADCSMPDFPVLFYFPEFAQTHAH